MRAGWKERRNEVGKSILVLLGVGMLYAFFCRITDLRIPCVVHAVTGWYCPGCGVTRMCLALLRLDFAAAYRSNQLLFLSLPLFSVLFGYEIYRFIRFGTWKTGKAVTALTVLLIVAFLVFGIVRNLPGMEALCPPAV